MKVTTTEIKKLIPNWLVNEEERLRNEFDPPIPKNELLGWRWIRETKRKYKNGWERVFDCVEADNQLRLYVITNSDDTQIVHYYFQTE